MVGERKMNIGNKILIHSLEQGYVITDYISGKKYAVESPESVLRIVGKALGIPELLPGWLIHLEKQETPEPHACMPDASLLSADKILGKTDNFLSADKTLTKTDDGNSFSPAFLQKADIMIKKFGYDHSLRKSIPEYKNTWYAELPDGRIVLGYGESSYYTTKENVMKIPFPVPYGYFKGSGISTTALTCLRAYRQTFAKSLIKTASCEKADDEEKETKQPVSDYVSKSTQDRIREAAEQKEAHRRKMDNGKGQTEMSEKTRKLRDMTIRMGIQ